MSESFPGVIITIMVLANAFTIDKLFEDQSRLSVRHQRYRFTHCDLNRGNAIEAQEKFQKISEAYDVLIDPQRRATFDQFGYEGLKNGVPDDNGNMTNGYAFSGKDSEQIFHNGIEKNGAEQAKPIEHDLQCTLEEICYGDVKEYQSNARDFLMTNLSMKARLLRSNQTRLERGTKITFEGEGNEFRQHESGYVVLRIAEAKHDLFSRDGANLVFTTKIKLVEPLGDHCVYVPHRWSIAGN
ncbi:unnamed protein product [Albugo candida]|uniref:J domain-containing protein n=1 Tax=Albugo candida TaxID=65357 RepID=A0A024FX61_9STRA|nr:unnamed protein product [Albugo candida]|eukprot:CCI11606.1 unnamed protein product [Albugo candida]